jgi:hypothetical protein
VRVTAAAFAVLLVGATACERSHRGAAAPAPAARPPSSARFQPPADGLLRPAHIDAYVRVRRAAKGRSDADAARAVGVSPDELAWTRARIVEALVALEADRVRRASLDVYGRTLASLRRTLDSLRDPESARRVQEQLAAIERERDSLRR